MACLYWPRYEARAVVRVQFPHSLFDLLEKGGPALGNQHDFGRRLDTACSTVEIGYLGIVYMAIGSSGAERTDSTLRMIGVISAVDVHRLPKLLAQPAP
jgi:hypothetical protein